VVGGNGPFTTDPVGETVTGDAVQDGVPVRARRARGSPALVMKLRAGLTRLLGGGESEQVAEMRRLFSTLGFLVAKTGATALIGLAYWAVATHLFSARDVGLAAAAASTGVLLATVGAVGVPLLLLAEIESVDPKERRVMFSTGMAITGTIVLVLATATMLLSPYLGKSLSVIGRDPVTAALFVVGSVATMCGLTLDDTAIGLHRGAAQLWRNSLSSLLKLAIVGLLVLTATRTGKGLILAWAVAMVLSVLVCLPMLALGRARPGEATIGHRTALVHRFGKLSLQHHVLNLSIGSVSYIIPLAATLLISPAEVAYFSAAFILAATLLILPYLLALSLFAERSGDVGLLHRNVRRTFPLGLVLSGAIVVVVEIAAPYALRLFGPAYPVHGSTALRLLILVGPAYVVKDHYVSIRRAQHRLAEASRVMMIGTIAEVAAAAVGGAMFGLNGICAGWAIAASSEAVVLLPGVLRVYRRDPPPTSHGRASPVEPGRVSDG
jgi:O-antigen/teichoic acid export membrane protein